MQVSHDSTDQPISNADVYDALEGERTEIEESRSMPKWLVQTLRDSKLDAPFLTCTRFGSQHASYASNCFALAVLQVCMMKKSLSCLKKHNIQKIGCYACGI